MWIDQANHLLKVKFYVIWMRGSSNSSTNNLRSNNSSRIYKAVQLLDAIVMQDCRTDVCAKVSWITHLTGIIHLSLIFMSRYCPCHDWLRVVIKH